MKVERDFEEVVTSGSMETQQAAIAMTPEMYKILSSGIYENKHAAIIREITCNGRDGHVARGNLDTPMLMHLPNSLEPWWFLRDYGTGLSHDQVMNMYLHYGVSTKGDSNDFIGAMGIGSKSPFSYTDNFVVTSYQNGIEIQYAVYLDNGIPNVSKLHEKPTEEDDGFKVFVAVQDTDFERFRSEAEKFLKLFTHEVEVVGSYVALEVEKREHEDYTIISSGFGRGIFALMGGVAYNVTNLASKVDHIDIQGALVLPYEIGDLSVAASRETLSMDDRTQKAIDGRIDKVSESIRKDVREAIDGAENILEATRIARNEFGFRFGQSSTGWMSYQDHTIEEWRGAICEFPSFSRSFYRGDQWNNFKLGNHAPFNNWRQDIHDNTVLVINDMRGTFKAAQIHSNKNNCLVMTIPEDSVNISFIREWLPKLFNTTIELGSNLVDRYDVGVKGANTVCPTTGAQKPRKKYIKSSGIFTVRGTNCKNNWMEVRKINPEQPAYYMMAERFDCHIESNGVKLQPVHVQTLFREYPVYVVRKTVAKSRIPDSFIEVTVDMIKKRFDKRVNKRYIKELAKQQEDCRPHNKVDSISLEVRKEINLGYYEKPISTSRVKDSHTIDRSVLVNLGEFCGRKGVVERFDNLVEHRENRQEKIDQKCAKVLEERYPLLELYSHVPYWRRDEKYEDEMLVYVQKINIADEVIKNKQEEITNE